MTQQQVVDLLLAEPCIEGVDQRPCIVRAKAGDRRVHPSLGRQHSGSGSQRGPIPGILALAPSHRSRNRKVGRAVQAGDVAERPKRGLVPDAGHKPRLRPLVVLCRRCERHPSEVEPVDYPVNTRPQFRLRDRARHRQQHPVLPKRGGATVGCVGDVLEASIVDCVEDGQRVPQRRSAGVFFAVRIVGAIAV